MQNLFRSKNAKSKKTTCVLEVAQRSRIALQFLQLLSFEIRINLNKEQSNKIVPKQFQATKCFPWLEKQILHNLLLKIKYLPSSCPLQILWMKSFSVILKWQFRAKKENANKKKIMHFMCTISLQYFSEHFVNYIFPAVMPDF